MSSCLPGKARWRCSPRPGPEPTPSPATFTLRCRRRSPFLLSHGIVITRVVHMRCLRNSSHRRSHGGVMERSTSRKLYLSGLALFFIGLFPRPLVAGDFGPAPRSENAAVLLVVGVGTLALL